ncbi:unnamed protein product [Symbiodinium microadriaticum]|nr:unnamed protein product [Symbiodinium microadriaticum]
MAQKGDSGVYAFRTGFRNICSGAPSSLFSSFPEDGERPNLRYRVRGVDGSLSKGNGAGAGSGTGATIHEAPRRLQIYCMTPPGKVRRSCPEQARRPSHR